MSGIANTIWQQIIAGGPRKVICWGVSRKVGSNEEGWLSFKVSGMKFKGFVKVIYCPGSDDYKIEFIKETKKKNPVTTLFESEFTVVETKEMIYCDQLTEVIDDYVERIPAYKY